jgi:cold shock CspA family protein/ribosome-associated translation inhibitor RaiA
MKIPLRVESRNVVLQPGITRRIERKAAKLEQAFDRIIDCRVAVDGPGAQRKGAEFNVRLDVSVPGNIIVVDRCRSTNLAVAIRQAFDAARRKLDEFSRIRRNDVKHHREPASGHIGRIFPDRGFGFIHLADGREVYFHQNSVADGGFVDLNVGDRVRFTEAEGDKGPQASAVSRA